MNAPRALALACLLLVGSSQRLFAKDDKVTVDGYVRDSANKPIAGVKVGLYTTGKRDAIDSVRTDMNGYYKISRKIDSTYDMMYTHTQMDLAVVELLIEDKNQQISIKMYKRGEQRSASAYHANLQAAERALFLLMSLKESDRKDAILEYSESGATALLRDTKMEVSEVPKEVQDLLKAKKSMLTSMQAKLGIK